MHVFFIILYMSKWMAPEHRHIRDCCWPCKRVHKGKSAFTHTHFTHFTHFTHTCHDLHHGRVGAPSHLLQLQLPPQDE
eukprot:1160412-Pelagomonas_calceolata.AAC.13